jgi:uncharacterized membrane protein YhiD involved in acid resistance
MNFEQIFSHTPAAVPHVPALIVRMALATVLGAFVALRGWRAFLPNTSPPGPQIVQAQTLMAAAGAVMIVVLGDHPARAFGLVGLGSFIRFRSGIADPRDAVVTFVMIGIGMACGLGLLTMAGVAAVLVSVILFLFDLGEWRLPRRTLVTINAEDPLLVMRRVLELFPHSRIVELSNNAVELGKESGRVVIEINLRGDLDAGTFRGQLEKSEVPGIRRVAFATE